MKMRIAPYEKKWELPTIGLAAPSFAERFARPYVDTSSGLKKEGQNMQK